MTFLAARIARLPAVAATGTALGSSPSYYETLGAADFNGDGSDEVFARTADGLRVYSFNGVLGGGFTALPTLTALGGAASSVQPGEWGSIRTGDILGNNRDQVLALDSNGLEAYSYQPSSQTWSQLPGSLGLTGDWLTNPAYYSTIQVGDVDGDGHADVVARGPFGIRTWFYNRRGIRGWARYLPGGYTEFPGTAPRRGSWGRVDPTLERARPETRGDHVGHDPRRVDDTANRSDVPTLLTTLSASRRTSRGRWWVSAAMRRGARAAYLLRVYAASAACQRRQRVYRGRLDGGGQ